MGQKGTEVKGVLEKGTINSFNPDEKEEGGNPKETSVVDSRTFVKRLFPPFLLVGVGGCVLGVYECVFYTTKS